MSEFPSDRYHYPAAREDYRSMGNEIDGARAQLALTTVEHPIRREIEEIIGLMVLAHDLLRPFAEGK